MASNGPDDSGQVFLQEVFDRSSGDPSRSVSMFAVGEGLGWERETASRVAQDLIGIGLLEIRSLSGGVALSAEGAEAVRTERAEHTPAGEPIGRGPVLTPAECRRTEAAVEKVRAEAVSNGRLSAEMDADLKSLAAQLASPRPGTAIVRACLQALLETAEPGALSGRAAIRDLLAERPA
jgi:hypothetical protein